MVVRELKNLTVVSGAKVEVALLEAFKIRISGSVLEMM